MEKQKGERILGKFFFCALEKKQAAENPQP
jgi:hypothetical protein